MSAFWHPFAEMSKVQHAPFIIDRGEGIYVFDEDGVRAGIVWYLHFRTADSLNDDSARVRARPFGLTDEGNEARALAVAAQRYLESR